MKILITGASGFVGKNLVANLKSENNHEIYEYDIDTAPSKLYTFARDCDFVFHLAGVNRPQNDEEFIKGNFGFTSHLLKTLKKYDNRCPVMLSSSTQAALDNPYGKSKKMGEQLLFDYGKQTGALTFVYRFPNVFGKWSRPNYNSVVATFCHNIARDLPIKVNDPDTQLNLVYIDDVVTELARALAGGPTKDGDYCTVPVVHSATLGRIAQLLYSFRDSRKTLAVPDMSDMFEKKLYSTYLSFLPPDGFGYPLKSNCDERGSFTEILKTPERGQFSVNITKPGITKGNHWHNTKNEKFLVVSGQGVIKFRRIGSDEVFIFLSVSIY